MTTGETDRAASRWLRAGGILGFLGVALGAFGAHFLEPMLEASGRADTWETAVLYQLVHAVALVALAALPTSPRTARIGFCWTGGTLVFSGSLYLLCLTGQTWLGAITPVGGVTLLAGWALLTLAPRPSSKG